jgi:TonB family protein
VITKKLILILFYTVSSQYLLGQWNMEMNLHFYGPISQETNGFKDSVLFFYDVYKSKVVNRIPEINVIREDYSPEPINQPFVLSNQTETNRKLIEPEVRDELLRSQAKAISYLHQKRGKRKYVKPNDGEVNVFYLGDKHLPHDRQYKSLKVLKEAIADYIKNNPEAVQVEIFFFSESNNRNDIFYEGEACRGVSQKEDASVYLSYTDKGFWYSKHLEYIKKINDNELNFLSSISLLNIRGEKVGNSEFHSQVKTSGLLYLDGSSIVDSTVVNGLGEVSQLLQLDLKRTLGPDTIFSRAKVKVDYNRNAEIISAQLNELKDIAQLDVMIDIYRTYGDSLNGVEKAPNRSEPLYPKGIEGLYEDIYKNIQYPEYELTLGIMGTVYVSFVVTKTGEITDIKVDREVKGGPGLSLAAIKATRRLNNFQPAMINGKPSNYRFRLPIMFKLTD